MAIRVQGTTIIDDSRNITNVESLNGISLGIVKPTIITPTDGDEIVSDEITVQSSPFRTAIGVDTHASSDWELATDSGFTNIVASLTDSTSNLTSWTVSGLSADTYFVRVRHSGTTLGDSEFSNVVSFSLTTQRIYGFAGPVLFGDASGKSGAPKVIELPGGKTDWIKLPDSQDGNYLGCAMIDSQNDLYMIGEENGVGQLGNGTTVSVTSPTLVIGGLKWDSVSLESDIAGTTIGITTDGYAYGWGSNGDNRLLGQGGSSPASLPTDIKWHQISVGRNHVGGISQDGALYLWGGNEEHFGTVNQPSSPVQYELATDWKQVSAGAVHLLALNESGQLFAGGVNSSGQLGDSTTTNRQTSPVLIRSDLNWDYINAEGNCSFGITTSGEGYAWGLNQSGILGVGVSDNPVTFPRTVAGGITDWTLIVGNAFNGTVFLRSDGSLYYAGSSNYLGGIYESSGTTINSSPISLTTGLSEWVDIIKGSRRGSWGLTTDSV